ncbi:MAG: GTPase ObgE, partial [Desulfobacterales bacterium]
YETINTELTQYNRGLSGKPQIVVLNKLDLPGTDENAKIFQAAIDHREGKEAILISAIEKKGITRLISKLLELLDQLHEK